MQRISPSPDDELDLTNGYVTDLACEESTLRFSLSDVLISPQHSMNDRKKYALCECTVIFEDVKRLELSEMRRICYELGNDPIKSAKKALNRPLSKQVYKSEYADILAELSSSDIGTFGEIPQDDGGDGTKCFEATLFHEDGERMFRLRYGFSQCHITITKVYDAPCRTATELMAMLPMIMYTLHDRNAPFAARFFSALAVCLLRSPVTLLPPFVRHKEDFTYPVAIPFLIGKAVEKMPVDTYRAFSGERKGEYPAEEKRWYYAVPLLILYIAAVSAVLILLIELITKK